MAAARRDARHTIVLIQTVADFSSRTFRDFETINAATDGIIKMYEARLKELNPGVTNITYDVADLFAYIDSLTDLSMLVLNPKAAMYEPYGKDWIKAQVYETLRRMAGQ